MNIVFRPIESTDAKAILHIYQQGIATGNATFQQTIPSWDDWDNSHLKVCRILAEIDGNIAGWVALSPTSKRYVYRGVAEVSIYIANAFKGKSVGKQLFKKLIEESEKENLWTLYSSIFPENIASIDLHKKLGFREVGYREKIGKMNGVWRDNIILERRSKIVGID